MLTVVWTGHGQQMSGGGRGVLVFDHDHAGHSTVNLLAGIESYYWRRQYLTHDPSVI